ncbi:hypothetical protein KD050_18800 [Psychrobacillus sp. INOP01]|uniref:hypothetical protein n=1 Tax=Psychrobacillus sp. INOP01 TaxID=2829187 RepID=UPI001BA6B0A4|nr:hypothetical protein [Psychrobacillus sp. INOP01]QUG41299.1 hypothetical protein KD050_18800 [Psychrobacillus sp. INOP01]
MKVSLSCIQCNVNNDNKFPNYSFELRDDNTYPITCEYGHESIVLMESHKFELLFEMGMKAMLDGYFREAVSNFAVSIERFHEFSIEVFIQSLFNIENPYNVNVLRLDRTSEYNKAWKELGNFSERQLGAYTMLYLSVFKCAPELIKQNQVQFRNKVIHKGYFPTEQETLTYAKYIFTYLQTKLLELKKNMNEYVEFTYDKKLREYISVEDINGKFLVKWGELLTFRTLRPVKEIEALDFDEVILERTHGYKPFNN